QFTDRTVLRGQHRLRGGHLARRACRGSLDRPVVAARFERRAAAARVRPAGVVVAGRATLQQRHGHRLPATRGGYRQRGPGAPAPGLTPPTPGASRMPLPSESASDASAADLDPLVERYLEHVRVEKRLAERTVTLYALDLARLGAHAR